MVEITPEQARLIDKWRDYKEEAIAIKSSLDKFKGEDAILNDLTLDETMKALLNGYKERSQKMVRIVDEVNYQKNDKESLKKMYA